MNLFELQENLKNFSQDQLVREMRNPSGSAPQYLILSELQRRRRIMNEEQAQMPQQVSVAEEAVAAAGMPQGGLAQMAQAMAPQTDMTQNTAAQPVERMSEGGLTGVSPRLTDFMPIGPSSRRASGRGIAITPMQMGQSIYEDYIDEMRRLEAERRGSPEGLDLGMTADEVNRRANQGRYDPADANPPTVGARDIADLAGEDPIDLRGEVEFPTIGAGLSSLLSPAPSRELDSVIDGLAGSGVESRFDPTDELRTYMSPAERTRMMLSDPDIIERAAALDLTPEQYISSLSPARQDAALQTAVNRAAVSMPAPRAAEDRMMFGETPIGAIQSERTEEPMDETLQRILRNSEAAIARESADRRAPDFVRGVSPVNDFSGRDFARDRRIAASVGRSDRRAQEDIARMFEDQALQDDLNFTAEEMFQRGLGTTDFGGAIDALPADTGMRTNVSGPGYQTRDVFIPADEFEQGLGTTDFGGNDPYSLPAEIILQQERERLAEQFQTEAEAADAETAAVDAEAAATLPPLDLTRTSGGADGAGGGVSGGGGSDEVAGGSRDDIFEQDKWLALAQFGLGLMSSRAPTLGQAIGEAGATGIAALRQARADQQERETAAQTRADRLAAAAARASGAGGFRDDEMDAIDNAIGELRQYREQFTDEFGNPLAGAEESLASIDAEIETYRLLQRAGIMQRFPELYQAAE